MRSFAHALVLALLLAPAAARGDPAWAKSFPPGPTAALFPRGRVVLLVGAGASASTEAARALRGALLTAAPWRQVVDASAIGDIASLDDQEILRRPARVRYDFAIVVRVFSVGAAESAVITTYDPSGRILFATSADKGRPIEAGATTVPAEGETATSDTAPEVAPLPSLGHDDESRSRAREEYDRRYIGFASVAGLASHAGGDSFRAPFRGKYHQVLPGAAFYEAVNRPDLANTYRRKRGTRIALMAAGGALIGVGFTGGLSVMLSATGRTTSVCDMYDPYFGTCARYKDDLRGLWAGLAVMGAGGLGGLSLLIAGAYVRVHPVTPDEARDLANQHNRRLRRELRLESEHGPGEPRAPASSSLDAPPVSLLSIEPAVLPGGGGIVVSGAF